MRSIVLVISILSIFTAISSCRKFGADCFTDPGNTIIETRLANTDFTSIELLGNVDIDLVHSTETRVDVMTGSNLISGITTTINDSTKALVIRNSNQCGFMYQNERFFKATIFYTHLDSITYRSNGNVRTLGKILADTFKLHIYEGSGTIDLQLETMTSYTNYHFGTASVTLRGKSTISYIYQVSYGPVDALNLLTEGTYMENRSPNHSWVNAKLELGATLNGKGNIYYRGNPLEFDFKGSGSGSIIAIP